MIKNPVYGFEKPYLENIKKENSVYVNEAYFDEFDNLIMIKNSQKEDAKSVVVGICVSENAFLVTDISEKGEMHSVPLFAPSDSITNERIMVGNKTGYITKSKENYTFDFGADDKKSAERIAKAGDTLYIKPYFETLGNYYFTNEKAYALKNIFDILIKNEYPDKMIFCFIREKAKGAYALGKNIKADNAFFITLFEDIKDDTAFLKKEKNYISEYKTDKLSAYISENNISNADSYYLAGGCNTAAGIALKCTSVGANAVKISKSSVDKLKDFLENLS